ncbi:hypothetical protein NITMOv2_1934 [Nitrospira moscoviensis]|uniref:Uncharacterized protein n=1 Tax=Nitrospira moscoviensis TaxID=42253 RepID=A0A0K2GBM6_NITMO|nr:hypothetical protein NITMOv2_1934 [Nitrospira moscoviensis]
MAFSDHGFLGVFDSLYLDLWLSDPLCIQGRFHGGSEARRQWTIGHCLNQNHLVRRIRS